MEIVLASGNQGKLVELSSLFDDERLKLIGLKGQVSSGFAVEETGATFEENAWLKAMAVCKETGKAALADDSGLSVDFLDGRPGVHSARFSGAGASDEENNAELLRRLKGVPPEGRHARFTCVLVLAVPGLQGLPEKRLHASGTLEGRIAVEPRGEKGFGYDPVFESLSDLGRTVAELSSQEKNAISHRATAARKLRPRLISWLDYRGK